MIKIIVKPNSKIKISVANEDAMYEIFFRLNGWMDLQVDNDYYPVRCEENHWHSYTKDYFKKKYFNDQLTP